MPLSENQNKAIMNSELIQALLLLACAVGLGAGVVWQFIRRRKPKRNRRRVERVGRRPAADAVKKAVQAEIKARQTPEADLRPDTGMERPVMLAVTGLRDSATAADLFIQRALDIDEDYYRVLDIDRRELAEISGLFTRNVTLEKFPGDGLSENVYSLNFSQLIQEALFNGYVPHPNVVSNDLSVLALSADMNLLGEPMAVEDHEFGCFPHIHTLWMMCNPTDKKHELDDILSEQLALIRAAMPRAKEMVPSFQGVRWCRHWDELFDLVRDVRRVGAAPGKAQERTRRMDDLKDAMWEINHRIDRSLETFVHNIRTPVEADMALTNCVSLMLERELTVLFLRAIALIRVMGADTYLHGVHCSGRIRSNVRTFPKVTALIDKARAIALHSLENPARAMDEPAMALAGKVNRDADDLAREHDQIVDRLWVDVARLEAAVDQYMILQGRPRRFAVRLKDDNTVDALLVLEH